MNQTEIVGRLLLDAHPIADAGKLLGEVVPMQIAPRQLGPERSVRVHQQQQIAVNGGDAGHRIAGFADPPFLEPGIPAKPTQIKR